MHTISIDHLVLEPEHGLILGNGDLSVSIYQTSDRLIWRFGKNDVWDRRLDLSDSPRPAHIEEIARGIRDEGWVAHNYQDGKGEATKGAKDPQRMKEITDGYPGYARYPYPCPKPVGELALHLPVDLRGMEIKQDLSIETGKADITCTWSSGVVIRCSCFIPPTPNVLVVKWEVEGWSDVGGAATPIWFSLRRWEDPSIDDFEAGLSSRALYSHFAPMTSWGKATPLPPPEIVDIGGHRAIEQRFHPDLRFMEGFRYAMVPFSDTVEPGDLDTYRANGAALRLKGEMANMHSGWLCVAVPTSTDEGGVEAEAGRIASTIEEDHVVSRWEEATTEAWNRFWSRSSIQLGDSDLIQRVWYETLYIRGCTYRADVIAPGLAYPSTVRDYSLWHGDYHTNYNYQSPFWGDYGANHLDVGDAYFPGMQYMIDIGRKMAREYWSARGTFIQLSGYPFEVADDPMGSGSLCRMGYMTGWVANHYWYRYRHTMDANWLKETGYPVIRDAALFYTDFLSKGEDGKYHAFPSSEGEQFYSGKMEDYTDKKQVVRHARYCLQIAIEAAEVLGIDSDLVGEWGDRLTHLVDVDNLQAMPASQRRLKELNPPEFTAYEGAGLPAEGERMKALEPNPDSYEWRYGFAQFPWRLMIALRGGVYDADRDLGAVKAHIQKWRYPNGYIGAMSTDIQSFMGAYGETAGILAPIQEMLLQSWEGVIRIFPAWPRAVDASFTTLRAEGAFLVSASLRGGKVEPVTIVSERGGVCRIASPWKNGAGLNDVEGQSMEVAYDEGILEFEATAGVEYTLSAG